MKDTLDVFLNEAGRIPLLTPAEEIHLGRRIQAMMQLKEENSGPYTTAQQRIIKRGIAARNRMISANLKLVAAICRKRQRSMGGFQASAEDMMQDGILGLIRGVEKFDPERGYKFSTYAYWWITQMMTRGIEANGRPIRLPHKIAEKFMGHNRIIQRLAGELGRQPSRSEVAEAMGITEDEYERALLLAAPCASLDIAIFDDGSDLGALIGDGSDADQHLEQVSDQIDTELLSTAMAALPERQQLIIKLRYGLDGNEPHTFTAIGRKLNVTREAVRLQAERAYKALQRQMLLAKQVKQPADDPWGMLAVV